MSERLIIEHQPFQVAEIASTIIRNNSKGFWVHTIPSADNILGRRSTYDTRVWEFDGYHLVRTKDGNQKPSPIGSDSGEDPLLKELSRYDEFEDNPEEAKKYHENVTERLCQTLEAG